MSIRFRQYCIRLVYIAVDFFLICIAIYLACAMRNTTLPFEITLSNVFFDTKNPYQFIFIFWKVSTILFLYSKNLYQTKRELLEGIEIIQLIKAVIYAAFVVIIAIYSLKTSGFPRSILFIGTVLNITFLSIWRVLKRSFVEYIVANGYNNFNVLIIGAGKVGTALVNEIKKRPGLGLKVVGFLDDFKAEPLDKKGPKILGKINDFKKIGRNEFVNKVFVTIHLDSDIFLSLLEQAKELGVAVRVVPHGFELMSGEYSKFNIGLIPVIEYCEERSFTKQASKRIFDLGLSLMAMSILLPFFVVLAVMIKINSPGSVFYLSRRYGQGGRIFRMLKFRTMVKDADEVMTRIKGKNEVDGPIFKMRNDPRTTSIGGFLRKYSLDELPQFINVIKGDMSLVGPRPLPVEQIEKEDLRQLKRLEVRPGITGLWQIRGRSDISFTRLVKWDVWYINNWSFWLDVNILLQTIPVVIRAKGAY